MDADLLEVNLIECALLVRSRRRVLEGKGTEQHDKEQHTARPHICMRVHSC
jgi:hypothetical protein